jgi:hypothetical protein
MTVQDTGVSAGRKRTPLNMLMREEEEEEEKKIERLFLTPLHIQQKPILKIDYFLLGTHLDRRDVFPDRDQIFVDPALLEQADGRRIEEYRGIYKKEREITASHKKMREKKREREKERRRCQF